MTHNHNVVDLKKRAAGSEKNASRNGGGAVSSIPAPLLKVRDKTIGQLKILLRQLFDNADDALFELADKAGSNGEQTKYFDAMRELRLQRKQAALLMLQAVVRSFNQVGDYKFSAKFDAEPGSTLESLSLVQNDELEERVAIEGMISKTRSSVGQALDHYELRVASLLPNIELDSAHTPASPEVLIHGFVDGCKDLEVDIAAKIVVFKLFEKYVLNQAADVYQKANSVLVEEGVMPDLQQLKRSGKSQTSRPAAGFERVDPSAGTTLDGETGEIIEEEGGLFQDLRDLLQSNNSGASSSSGHGGMTGPRQGSGVGAPITQVEISRDQLLSVLSGVQHQLDSAHSYSVDSGVMNFRALLVDNASTADNETTKFNQVDDDVINLISMLFEFILDDRQLQPTMKALIARLQIPMLKVAMLDRTFFNKGGHPARKLLNEIAAAAIGWNEKPEGQRDPLKEKVEYIVQHLLDDFDNDFTVFSDLLAEFTRFLDIENRRGQLVEQRTKDAEEGRAKNEISKTLVQKAIQDAIADNDVPEAARTLLDQGWGQYMSLTFLKHGEQSAEWKSTVKVAQDLVWSVCPDHSVADARTTLLKLIPVLLKKVRFGLSEVSFDPFKSNQLLKSLEGLHVDALQRLAMTPQTPEPVVGEVDTDTVSVEALGKRPETSISSESVAAEVEEKTEEAIDTFDASAFLEETSLFIEGEGIMPDNADEPVLEQPVELDEAPAQPLVKPETNDEHRLEVTEAEAVEPEMAEPVDANDVVDSGAQVVDDETSIKMLDSLRVGSWLEIQHEDKTARCKLAAIIRVTGKYIFVDRSGIKISEKVKDELLGMIKCGEVTMLNDGLLFDRALESVIGNLRNSRKD